MGSQVHGVVAETRSKMRWKRVRNLVLHGAKFFSISRPRPKTSPSYMPPRLKSLIIKGVNFGSWSRMRMHPFFWDEESDRMVQRTDRLSQTLWFLVRVAMYLTYAFVVLRAVHAIRSETIPRGIQVFSVFFACFYVFPILFELTIWNYHDELAECLNCAMTLFKAFDQVMPGIPHRGKGWIFEIRVTYQFQLCSYYGILFLWFINMTLVIVKPELPVFISSMVDSNSGYYPSLFVVSVLVTAFYTTVYVSTCIPLIFIGAALGFGLVASIKALSTRPMRTKAECMVNIRRYNELRLMTNRLDDAIFSFLVPYSENFLIILSTFSLVGAIRFSGLVAVFLTSVGVMAYAILWVICYGAGDAQHKGSRLLNKWRHDPGVDQRIIRCLRPLRAALGPYGYIDRGLILTATNIILGNSITLLLAAS